MDNQTVCPNCQESDKGCVQYGCWKRTPSTREEALQRIIADLEFHMRTGTLCPNLDVERGVRAVLDRVKELETMLHIRSIEVAKEEEMTDAIQAENERLKAQLKTVLDREAESQRRHDTKVAALEAQIAAYEMPVSDEECGRFAHYVKQDGIPSLAVRLNDIPELIVSRKLPPPAITDAVTLLERIEQVAKQTASLPEWKKGEQVNERLPAITDADAKQQAIKDRQQDAKEGA